MYCSIQRFIREIHIPQCLLILKNAGNIVQGNFTNSVARTLNTSAINMDNKWDRWPIKKPKLAEKDTDDSISEQEEKFERIKKKKFAILLAYSGVGYLGLQRNTGYKTIEEELLIALKKLDIVNDEEFAKQQAVHFQRAARTDKGVSALRQVISLDMREGVKPEEINEHLPDQIRALAVRRVTKKFNSKNNCDSRTYSYTCPTYAFDLKDNPISEDYRITEEVMKKLDEIIPLYAGSHNFHNFTSGRRPRDPSCKRYILSIKYNQPVVTDGLELITFLIKGQSFMLHQIRKMMGVLICICRGFYDANFIPTAYDPEEKHNIPVAPGLGLLLEQIHYDWYNNKYSKDGFHESLDFNELETAVEEFREKHIYPSILKGEKEEKSMVTWLESLPEHFEYNDLKPEECNADDVAAEEKSESHYLHLENDATKENVEAEKLLESEQIVLISNPEIVSINNVEDKQQSISMTKVTIET